MSLACSSLGAEPVPASDRASFSGLSPTHASSLADSSERSAKESSTWRGASTPRSAGVAIGWGVGGLAGVALGAAVGLSVGAWVETEASVDAGVATLADTWVGVGTSSGAGVVSEQAVRVARAIRKNMVAGRNSFSTGSYLSFLSRGSGFAFHSTCRLPFPYHIACDRCSCRLA